LARNKPRVVICNTLLTLPVVLAASRLGLHTIWLIHESEGVAFFKECDPILSAYFLPLAMASAQHVVFVSQECREHYSEYDVSQNFSVIRNGVNPVAAEILACSKAQARKQLKLPAKPFLLLNVGTLCERKAQLRLVKLAQALEQQQLHLDLQFLLLGPDSDGYQAQIETAIAQLGFYKNRFFLLGEIKDPSIYYRAADLFAFTSTREAYPTVLTEALAHGLPIISTPAEGVRDIVFHEEIGKIADIQEIQQWIDFIVQMQDKALLKTYAHNALQASQFLPQWDEVKTSYQRLM
jgi:glycosyltransferase involved in cell wall biosynthesis